MSMVLYWNNFIGFSNFVYVNKQFEMPQLFKNIFKSNNNDSKYFFLYYLKNSRTQSYEDVKYRILNSYKKNGGKQILNLKWIKKISYSILYKNSYRILQNIVLNESYIQLEEWSFIFFEIHP